MERVKPLLQRMTLIRDHTDPLKNSFRLFSSRTEQDTRGGTIKEVREEVQ